MKRVWLLLFALGCSDDFAPASLIEEARVIGAELAVVGAPERPIPTRGESVDVRWVVVSADNDDFTWVMVACEALPSPVGRPVCAAEPFSIAASEAPTAVDPMFTLDVPLELGADSEVLVLGVLCPEGVPDVDGLANSRALDIDTVCTAGRGQIIIQSIRTHVDSSNTNPRWPDDAVFIDGTPWPEESCPEIVAGSKVELTLGEFPDALRETYTRTTNDIPPRDVELREVLLVSHLMTYGELSRQFSAIDGESEVRPVEWEAPEVPPSEPVRFHLGLRDQRSGAAFIERRICVIP